MTVETSTHYYVSSPLGFVYINGYFQLPSSDSVPELSSPPVMTTPTGVVSIIGEVTHPPPGLPLPPQYNIGEYIGQHGWAANIIVSPLNPPIEVSMS